MKTPRHALLLTSTLVLALNAIGIAQEEEKSADSHQQIQLRVEFYDLPAAEALRIQQQVSIQPNQNETLKQILAMVESGDAAFVSSAPLVARSETRSKYEDTKEVQAVDSFEWNEEAKQLIPKFVKRSAGTVFEVDPLVVPGSDTINLNFALEHHTGEPELETIQVPLGESGDSKEVSVTRFHLKKITTRLFIKSGTSALIGAFEITGSPSSSSRPAIPDAKRLAFLRADLQAPAEP